MMVSFLVCVYYNIIIAWCLYYLFLSMAKDVPWKSCGNWWNTPKCLSGPIPPITNNCTALSSNTSNTLVNGTNALVNATASLVNSSFSNCTSQGAPKYTSPPMEYWE